MPVHFSTAARWKRPPSAIWSNGTAGGEQVSFARSYMSRVEHGKANPSLDAIEVLADALGIEVKELFDSSKTKYQARP